MAFSDLELFHCFAQKQDRARLSTGVPEAFPYGELWLAKISSGHKNPPLALRRPVTSRCFALRSAQRLEAPAAPAAPAAALAGSEPGSEPAAAVAGGSSVDDHAGLGPFDSVGELLAESVFSGRQFPSSSPWFAKPSFSKMVSFWGHLLCIALVRVPPKTGPDFAPLFSKN